MIWLLVAAAFAMPLRLTPSPGATVTVLPYTGARRVDILIHENRVDLRPQMGDTVLEGIRSWRLVDMGTVWLLTLTMRDEATSVTMLREGDTWTGSPGRWHPPGMPVGGVCDAIPRSPLLPLNARDTLSEFEVEYVMPVPPRWEDAEPDAPTWAQVSDLRRTLQPLDAKGHYTLGALHRELGHAREAIYYFSEAVRLGAPGGATLLQRAGVQLTIRDWPEAGKSATVAREIGADEEVLAQVDGIVALMRDSPDKITVGRALALASGRANSSLVAGALLLRGGCTVEAASVLQRAVRDPNPALANQALRLLVDARILRGDLASAETALKALTLRVVPPTYSGSLRSVTRLLALLRQPPDAWAVLVPTLDRLGRGDDEEAYESLYLLGQISEALGDDSTAIRAWTSLVDRDRRLLVGEPGRRLTGRWQARVQALIADGRDLDALALHNGVWRPGLIRNVTDPTPLYKLAGAAERLGMYGPARDLMGIAAEVEARYLLDDRASYLTIARLYYLSGRLPEAQESLALLAARPADPRLAPRIALLRGAMLEDIGNDEAAAAFYASVPATAPESGEAVLRRAMVDAHRGRCTEALAVLQSPPQPFPAAVRKAEVDEDAARCLFALGRPEEARVVAARAAEGLADPAALGFASWTSGTPSVTGDIWTRLRGEDDAQTALDARVQAGKGNP